MVISSLGGKGLFRRPRGTDQSAQRRIYTPPGADFPRDIYGPKPYEFIGFGDIHGPKPYEFIGFGDIHGPKPYEFIGFGDIHGPGEVFSANEYSMVRNSASGPEIGLPGRILAGLLPGKHQNRPFGRPYYAPIGPIRPLLRNIE